MSELRPSPDAALAPVSQEPVRPALTPATPAPASAAKKRSQAESQAAVLESARHAAPPPFKLWEPYGPVPPPDDDEIAAWRAGVAGWTGLPASGAGGLARKPGGLFIPIAAVLVLVLLAGSLTAFGAAGLGPLGFLHGPKPIVTSTLRPSPSAVTQMPAGHSTIVIRQSDPITVLPAQQKTVTASCQSGEQLVGGGYAITPSAVALTADASYPSGLSTWTATLTNDMQQPVRLSVFATCLPSSTNLAIQLVRSNPTTFASAENAPPAVARCPAPGVSIGGGFSTTPASNGVVISSLPGPSQQAWSVTASAANSPLTITAYALCATVHLANRLTPMQSLTITPGKVNQTMVTCAAGGLLTSAGFSDTSATAAGLLFFPAIQPEPGASSWQMSAYTSDTKTTHTAKITAVCIKVL